MLTTCTLYYPRTGVRELYHIRLVSTTPLPPLSRACLAL
uniref:Uncharacterized protein n=1 Tax=Siphoviridae sp. ctXOZ1 TaxID=2823585 RepID=A0A8S5LBE2_9CAUD|nr:MAG TPA: hypothetical protein [Siphoviridae sp. ctXOZ1]